MKKSARHRIDTIVRFTYSTYIKNVTYTENEVINRENFGQFKELIKRSDVVKWEVYQYGEFDLESAMNEDKKKCLISFSGGETSAYMLWWLLNHKSDEFHFEIVFANTGQENEETLNFVRKCSDLFGVKINWIEANPRIKYNGEVKSMYDHLHEIREIEWEGARLGTRHKIVNYFFASRDGKPYEAVIARYGLPNTTSPHCTRELKLSPINSYVRNVLKWNKGEYFTAIGIREDEFDRMNPDYKENKFWYPLISNQAMTKTKINFWWKMQEFRLNLKGYQGNCKWCFKKSDNKLRTIAKENPEHFSFPKKMEVKYGDYVTPDRARTLVKKGKEIPKTINIFRNNRTSSDLVRESKSFKRIVLDDSELYSESCDIHSSCGDEQQLSIDF